MVAGLAYWLVTVGAPGAWLARHWRATPDRVLIVAASVVGSIAAVALAWFRRGTRPAAVGAVAARSARGLDRAAPRQ